MSFDRFLQIWSNSLCLGPSEFQENSPVVSRLKQASDNSLFSRLTPVYSVLRTENNAICKSRKNWIYIAGMIKINPKFKFGARPPGNSPHIFCSKLGEATKFWSHINLLWLLDIQGQFCVQSNQGFEKGIDSVLRQCKFLDNINSGASEKEFTLKICC